MIPPIKLKAIQQGLALLSQKELEDLIDDLDDIERTPPGKDWKKGDWRKRASTAAAPKGVQQAYKTITDYQDAEREKAINKPRFSNWMNKTKKMFGRGG